MVALRLSLYRMLRFSDLPPCRATLDERKYREGRWGTGAQVTAPFQLPCSLLGTCFWGFYSPFPRFGWGCCHLCLCAIPCSLLHLHFQPSLLSSSATWPFQAHTSCRVRARQEGPAGMGDPQPCGVLAAPGAGRWDAQRETNGEREEETGPCVPV